MLGDLQELITVGEQLLPFLKDSNRARSAVMLPAIIAQEMAVLRIFENSWEQSRLANLAQVVLAKADELLRPLKRNTPMKNDGKRRHCILKFLRNSSQFRPEWAPQVEIEWRAMMRIVVRATRKAFSKCRIGLNLLWSWTKEEERAHRGETIHGTEAPGSSSSFQTSDVVPEDVGSALTKLLYKVRRARAITSMSTTFLASWIRTCEQTVNQCAFSRPAYNVQQAHDTLLSCSAAADSRG